LGIELGIAVSLDNTLFSVKEILMNQSEALDNRWWKTTNLRPKSINNETLKSKRLSLSKPKQNLTFSPVN